VKNWTYLFSYLYVPWFYVANALAILLLLPFLFLSSLRKEWYPWFFQLERLWARLSLFFCGMWAVIDWEERPRADGQYIIVANHTSMIDIHLTLRVFYNRFLFIGKKELTKLPLFGYFYQKTNLLVDRKSLNSRREVFEKAGHALRDGVGLCIYPEGIAQDFKLLAPFKVGAFRLAVEHQVPIIPVSFYDSRFRLPFGIAGAGPGRLRVTVHKAIYPQSQDPQEAKRLKEASYNVISQALYAKIPHYETDPRRSR
jgi:1-acyl-sn-glycerol-3-phosphate acyltransferase